MTTKPPAGQPCDPRLSRVRERFGSPEHLDLTPAEAVDRLQGRYPESVADDDKVHDAILPMADRLSSGIIQQFPQKF